MRNEQKMKRIATYVFLILVSVIFFFPFYFLIVSITNPSIDITRGRLLPGPHLIENFKTMMETTPISQSIVNSAIVSVGQTIISIFV
ncbi:MAG: carbohydrate ABC transporter permease, partial [Alkalibacterium sp.]